MNFTPALSTIAETIQTAIAPVFLLAGIGSFLNVLTGRLSRVVDRARALESLHPQTSGLAHERFVWELKRLDRRMRVINRSLMSTVTSAVAICAVVAMLFVAELGNLRIGREIAAVFIFAMVALTVGFVGFMVEVQLSLRVTRIRRELLEAKLSE